MIKEKMELTALYCEKDQKPAGRYETGIYWLPPSRLSELVIDEVLTIAQKHPKLKVMHWDVGYDVELLPKLSYWKEIQDEKLYGSEYYESVETAEESSHVSQHILYKPYLYVYLQ